MFSYIANSLLPSSSANQMATKEGELEIESVTGTLKAVQNANNQIESQQLLECKIQFKKVIILVLL